MTTCDWARSASPDAVRPPGARPARPDVTWSQWFAVFNWVNWLGLSLFLWPIVIGYFGVHWWLLQHDPVLYDVSLYAQLGLILVSWRQLW